jgi:hypothetical protein
MQSAQHGADPENALCSANIRAEVGRYDKFPPAPDQPLAAELEKQSARVATPLGQLERTGMIAAAGR